MASSPISEMNKPEAERCIEIALAAQQAGDIAKAERFLAKSISMFPTTKAQQLLVQVRTQSTSTSSASASAASPGSDASSTFTFQQQTSTSTSTTYQRKRSRSTSPARAAAPTYTAEQREAARAVIRLTNLYHILQLPLPTSATPPVDADIKAAYRKQALKFHPDKNRAPEAEEAFKKVSAAFQCLSDDRKRAAYDASGYQEGRPGLGMGGGGGGGGSGGGGGYYTREEDISPEDIFNMFFGGMSAGGGIYNMNGRRVFTRRRQYPPQGQQQQPQNGTGQTGGPAGLMQLVHFLPLLLLFLFSFLSSPASDESLPFSLTRTNTFPTQHSTPANLIYFTQPSFDYRYGRDRRMLRQVEDQVEQAYVKKWREGCSREEAELKRMRKEMEKRSGKEQLDVMEKIEQFEAKGMKNCASLADLKAHG